MNKLLILFASILISAQFTQTQIVVLKSGDLSKLNNERTFLIEYDYAGMRVGKFANEQDYINMKVKKYNEKEEGLGKKWRNRWINNRKMKFHPQFEKSINRRLKKANVKVGNENKDAKYTLILKVTFTEPGFFSVFANQYATINVELHIVESLNHNSEIAYIISKNNMEKKFKTKSENFSVEERLQEAYARCGKELGIFLYDNVWE